MNSPLTSRSVPRTRVLRGVAAPALRFGTLAELPAVTAAAVPSPSVPTAQDGYEAGFAEGHAEGYEAGRALALAEGVEDRRRVERALSALTLAARSFEEHAAVAVDGLARELSETAVALAEAVLGREIAGTETAGADALARALALAPSGTPAVARLHPDDAAVAGGVAASAAIPPGVTIVADPAVERGGCLLEVGDCRIDAQLGPALARARAVLLGEEA